jgi:hypothetical protein
MVQLSHTLLRTLTIATLTLTGASVFAEPAVPRPQPVANVLKEFGSRGPLAGTQVKQKIILREDKRRLARARAESARLRAENQKLKQELLAALTPPVVEMTAILGFQDRSGRPVNGLNLVVEAFDKDGKAVQTERLVTGSFEPGAVSVKLKQASVVLVPTIAPSSPWAITQPRDTTVAIKGTEGVVVAENFQASPFASLPLYASMAAQRPDDAFRFEDLFAQKKAPPKKPKPPKKPAPPQKGAKAPAKPKVVKRLLRIPVYTVERTVADVQITAPAGAVVRIGDQTVTTKGPGEEALLFPSTDGASTDVPVTAIREVEGRTFTGVVNLPKLDTLEVNKANFSDLELSAIRGLQSPHIDLAKIGTMEEKEVRDSLGKPERIVNPLKSDPDKIQTWEYPKKGLEVRFREILRSDSKPRLVVERVRFTSPGSVNIGGIAPGDPPSKLTEILGKGKAPKGEARSFGLTGYLDDGLVFKDDGEKVLWVEVRRDSALLESGIEASPPAFRTKIYLEPPANSSNEGSEALSLIRSWLESTPGLTFVARPEESDYQLRLVLEQVEDRKDHIIGGIAYKVNAQARVSFELIDTETGQVAESPFGLGSVKGVRTGVARTSFEDDIIGGGTVLLIALLAADMIKDELAKRAAQLAVLALGAWSVEKMKEVMARATVRTRRLAVRDACLDVASALASATGSPARVVDVDRATGQLTLNAGSGHGLKVGSEFLLDNGLTAAFPYKQNGVGMEIVMARVIKVEETTAYCELIAVKETLGRDAKVVTKEDKASAMANRIQDPRTGRVYAKPFVRFVEG